MEISIKTLSLVMCLSLRKSKSVIVQKSCLSGKKLDFRVANTFYYEVIYEF